jgi:hypothetical protein
MSGYAGAFDRSMQHHLMFRRSVISKLEAFREANTEPSPSYDQKNFTTIQ